MKIWAEFLEWLRRKEAAFSTEFADRLLTDWMDHEYLDGWNPERGSSLIAAVKWIHPIFARGGAPLPMTYQALKGWKRKVPSRSRLPLPWEVVALIATRLLEKSLSGRWSSMC